MKFGVEFSTNSCTSLGSKDKDVVTYCGEAKLMGNTIATIGHHEQHSTEKSVITALKQIIREINNNQGYSY